MSTLFDYIPHPHAEKRKAAGPPKVAAAAAELHGPGAIGKLNAKIGLRITLIVGTMWCAYLFTVLSLVSAPSAFESGNMLIIVGWIAQTFLQLVLLPIIIVGQNVQSAAADARSQATYDDAAAVLEEAKQIQAHLAAQDAAIERILAAIAADTAGARGAAATRKAAPAAPRKATAATPRKSTAAAPRKTAASATRKGAASAPRKAAARTGGGGARARKTT
ncbi:MAG: DUF1003 domain-containing protein [Frankiaceae bacterium]|nr:DUF1003 domain-containing protein [Frankiaceae bacterium]MBV9369993.1 DUF1003 domain-containing protein [Frankiales bacterium]